MVHTVAAPKGSEATAHGNGEVHPKAGFWALTLGSLGVVYGDIGTSPLYALREAVVAATATGGTPTRAAVLGVLSLILWALILIVTLKYVLILLRADNNGEGGTLTLMGLAQRAMGRAGSAVVLLGIISGALFYGDAVITPALSVLSAIEGLKVVTPAFEPYVVPLTIVILVALFAVQSRGTGKMGALFGPITTIWFIAIAIPGVIYIASDPSILLAFNPGYGISFLATHGYIGLLTLGAASPLPSAAAIGLMTTAARTDHKGKGFFVFKGGWEYTAVVSLVAASSSSDQARAPTSSHSVPAASDISEACSPLRRSRR